jgi:hypothetical protein
MGNTASLLSLPALVTSLQDLQLDNLDLSSLTKTMEEKLGALPDLVNDIPEVQGSAGKIDVLKTSSTVLSKVVKLSRDAPEQLSSIPTTEWPVNLRVELEEDAYVFISGLHHLPLISSISFKKMAERDFDAEGIIGSLFWDQWNIDMKNLIFMVKLFDCSMSLRN